MTTGPGHAPDPEEGKTAHDGELIEQGGRLLGRGEKGKPGDEEISLSPNDFDFDSLLTVGRPMRVFDTIRFLQARTPTAG